MTKRWKKKNQTGSYICAQDDKHHLNEMKCWWTLLNKKGEKIRMISTHALMSLPWHGSRLTLSFEWHTTSGRLTWCRSTHVEKIIIWQDVCGDFRTQRFFCVSLLRFLWSEDGFENSDCLISWLSSSTEVQSGCLCAKNSGYSVVKRTEARKSTVNVNANDEYDPERRQNATK